MARGLNKVHIIGTVGKDPEIRATSSGTVVANFSVAVNDREKDTSGQWVDKVEWLNLVAFSRTAEIARDYVKKGTPVYVEGKIQTRSWDDKQTGEKKYKTEIVVNELILLGSKGEQDTTTERPASRQPAQRTTPRATAAPQTRAVPSAPAKSADPFDDDSLGITDDDIPF